MTPIGELIPGFVADLERRRTHPLVELEDDGHFVFHHYEVGGAYDFKPANPGECLWWIVHMIEKTWVTREHIELFARLAADHFGQPRP